MLRTRSAPELASATDHGLAQPRSGLVADAAAHELEERRLQRSVDVLQVAEHERQRVVDLVRDAGRERAHRDHALRDRELVAGGDELLGPRGDPPLELLVAGREPLLRATEILGQRRVLEPELLGDDQAAAARAGDLRHRDAEERRHRAERDMDLVALEEHASRDGQQRRGREGDERGQEGAGRRRRARRHSPQHQKDHRLAHDVARRVEGEGRGAPRQAVGQGAGREQPAPALGLARARGAAQVDAPRDQPGDGDGVDRRQPGDDRRGRGRAPEHVGEQGRVDDDRHEGQRGLRVQPPDLLGDDQLREGVGPLRLDPIDGRCCHGPLSTRRCALSSGLAEERLPRLPPTSRRDRPRAPRAAPARASSAAGSDAPCRWPRRCAIRCRRASRARRAGSFARSPR